MKKGLRQYLLIVLFALFAQLSIAQQRNQAYIGQNHWLNVAQVWGQVTNMQPEIIRVGGIEFNSNYYGTQWYDQVLNRIESAGAEPMIQISEQWSNAQFTQLMQHFVNTGRDIKYFGIGNEPDHQNRVPNTADIIAYYNNLGPRIRQYYPDCILIGPCWANFYDGFIRDKYFPFIDGTKDTQDANGRYILDVFSFHTYASAFNSNGQGIFNLATFESRMNILLPKIAEVNLTRPADQQLTWSVTEFHTTYHNTELNIGGTNRLVPETHKTYSFYAGQYFAQLYGYAMEHNAFGMMPWSLIEGEQERNFGDLGIFDHAQSNYAPRSTYHHTAMLATNLRANAVNNQDNRPDVEIVSMHDETGTAVMVMNTRLNSYDLTLKLNMQAVATSNQLIINVDANSSTEITDAITAETTKLFVFNENGRLVQTVTYTKTNADNRLGPSIQNYNPVITHTISGRVSAEEYSDQFGLQLLPLIPAEGEGNHIAYTDVGDWAEYNINVTRSGDYQVDFRVASLSGGAGLSLSIDGNLIIDDLAVEQTGGWQEWETISRTVSLTEGEQTLRFDVIRAPFNLNWMEFTFIPVLNEIPGRIQAEDYSDQFGLQLEDVIATEGTGQNLGYTTVGDWAEYSVKILLSGDYDLDFRVASLSGGAGLRLLLDGEILIEDLTIESTNAWQNWTTLSDRIYLTEGIHTLRFEVLRAGFNLYWMEFTPSTLVSTTQQTILEAIVAYPNPVNDILHLSTIIPWELYTIKGEKLTQGNGGSIDMSSYQNGLYQLKLGDIMFKVVKQ